MIVLGVMLCILAPAGAAIVPNGLEGIIFFVFRPARLFSSEFVCSAVLIITGGFILAAGLVLFVQSIRLFILIENGTLPPWNTTKKLVVRGLYRHVRNPMILGVFLILLSEAILLNYFPFMCWAFIFITINHFYFITKEEPGLLSRFGKEYAEYKQHVPRWIPRIIPWRPENNQ